MPERAARRQTTAVRVGAFAGDRLRDRPDRLATEEPMEIRLEGPGAPPEPLAVVMRTPGHDFELAVGFCITEGIIDSGAELAEVKYCQGPDVVQEYNVVTVATRQPVSLDGHRRAFTATASCGVCGKATLDELEVACAPIAPGPTVAMSTVIGLPDALGPHQALFHATGGLHAAAIATPDGTIAAVREDVGRHNAVDKLVGLAALEGRLPLREVMLAVSGRVSFEIVQKAARAGIPIIVAVSAPSSLAVATAERLGMTLVGFVRDGGANVYSGAERLVMD